MTCQHCKTAFDDINDTVTLTGAHPQLHCPMCGEPGEEAQFAGVLPDPERKDLLLWEGAPPPRKIGGLEVRFDGTPARVADCLYERLVFFEKADPRAVCPVRPDKRHLVARWNLARGGTTNGVAVYDVVTRDGHSTQVTCECVRIENRPPATEAALLVWPKFAMPGWRRYYVGFHTPNVPDGRGFIGRVFLGGRIVEVQGNYAQLDQAPDCIEIVWEDARHPLTYYAGIVPKWERVEPSPVKELWIGFDFGTSNTAAAVLVKPLASGQEDARLIEVGDLTNEVIPGAVREETTWLPRPEKPAPSLPSQLYFLRDDLLPHSLSENLVPALDYCIPYSQEDRNDTKSVGGFKWLKTLPEGLDRKATAATLRYLYLKLVLEMFLAQVARERKVAGPAKLVATYPLAYEEDDMRLHRDSFVRVLQELKAYTPFELEPDFQWNESHAGENGGEPIPDVHEVLIADVGGGTTDICISEIVTGKGDPRVEVRQQDSILYGGENVNQAILRLTDKWSINMVRHRIRTQTAVILEQDRTFLHGAGGRRQARRVVEIFQAGLVELCARLLAARLQSVWREADQPPAFGLLMLGNGWRLLQPLAERANQTLQEYVQGLVERRLKEYFTAGVIGRLPGRLTVRHPADPKGVVALGAARAEDMGDNPPRPNRESYMLLNVTMNVGRATKAVTWDTPIPLTLDSTLLSLRMETDRFAFRPVHAVRVKDKPEEAGIPIADFNFRGKCEMDKRIHTSPFAIYLQYYAKGLQDALAQDTAP